MRLIALLAAMLSGCVVHTTTVTELGNASPDEPVGCVWIAAVESRQTVVFGLRGSRQSTRPTDAVYLCCPGVTGTPDPVCAEAEWLRLTD